VRKEKIKRTLSGKRAAYYSWAREKSCSVFSRRKNLDESPELFKRKEGKKRRKAKKKGK